MCVCVCVCVYIYIYICIRGSLKKMGLFLKKANFYFFMNANAAFG